jgi:D-sedoheptulose 7-phosphate isomerase
VRIVVCGSFNYRLFNLIIHTIGKDKTMLNTIIDDHIRCMQRMRTLDEDIEKTGATLLNCLLRGGKLMICGNGGSASDAQHFAAEIIGRFERDRRAYPAIALSTDTSILTAVGNDYGYAEVFARQVDGLGRIGDILVAISTSGHSPNVVRAVERARVLGIQSVGLLGKDGGILGEHVDQAIIVDDSVTARIQEAHIFILHYWAWQIENGLLAREKERQ